MGSITTTLPLDSTTQTDQPIPSKLDSKHKLQNLQRKLAEVIGEIMTLLAKEKDPVSNVELQKRYTIAILRISDLKQSEGKLGLTAMVVNLVFIIGTLPVVDPTQQRVIQDLGSKIIGASQGLFSAKYESEIKRQEGYSGIKYLELQEKSMRAQGENNVQDKLLQALQQLQQLINAAASSAGG